MSSEGVLHGLFAGCCALAVGSGCTSHSSSDDPNQGGRTGGVSGAASPAGASDSLAQGGRAVSGAGNAAAGQTGGIGGDARAGTAGMARAGAGGTNGGAGSAGALGTDGGTRAATGGIAGDGGRSGQAGTSGATAGGDGSDAGMGGVDSGPFLSPCFTQGEFETCDESCSSLGATCVAEGCNQDTWVGWPAEDLERCETNDRFFRADAGRCDSEIGWGSTNFYTRCCCAY